MYNAPKLLVTNTRSLVPKIVELEEFLLRTNVNLAFISETWLKESIADSVVNIPGYSIIRRDRRANAHGGVCLYISENYGKYRQLEEVKCCEYHEIMWVILRPSCLPRGFSCLVVAV